MIHLADRTPAYRGKHVSSLDGQYIGVVDGPSPADETTVAVRRPDGALCEYGFAELTTAFSG